MSRTSQSTIFAASDGVAIVKSMIGDPFLFWNVGFRPVLHIVSPRPLIRSDSVSPHLLLVLDPQSGWWALMSSISRTSEWVEIRLSSSLTRNSKYSRCVVFGEP